VPFSTRNLSSGASNPITTNDLHFETARNFGMAKQGLIARQFMPWPMLGWANSMRKTRAVKSVVASSRTVVPKHVLS
jgi:hypothetical protein